MALDPIATGDAIAAFVVSRRPDPGVTISDADLRALWEGIMSIIYADLAARAQVAPGSLEVSGYGPVSGIGGPIT